MQDGYHAYCLMPISSITWQLHNLFLQFFEDEGDTLFSRIVISGETWHHHSTPETNARVWCDKKKGEKAPQKTKVIESAGKVMATFFWDSRRVLLIDYLPHGMTINTVQ